MQRAWGSRIFRGYNAPMKLQTRRLGEAALVALLVAGCRPAPRQASGSAIRALSQKPAVAGFARAFAPRPFVFPADDGPHPDFQTEWWYFTGNLATGEGRSFGYQLTFFRRGLKPGQDARGDDWPTSQIWFAHFTLTDVAGGKFYPFERWGRQSIGLAGAQAEPFGVWLDHWSLRGVPGKGSSELRLQAAEGPVKLELSLRDPRPPVLQGDRGLSQKSAERGNASYYYSRPRMASSGRVQIGDAAYVVSGQSWMDREWSTSALSGAQSGWDWFSLQLDDGRALMLYQLRLKHGGIDPFSAGTLINGDGSTRRLGPKDFHIEPSGSWTSPQTGARYPSGWRLSLPGLKLRVTPRLQDQELPLSFSYWEGAVAVSGEQGAPGGQGYVELTGYGETP